MRRGGVGPCVAERSETGFPIGDRRERVQQVARRSRQPVEPRHQQHVASVELVEYPAKLRPVGLRSARHFTEHLARPVLPQRHNLSRDALAVSRYPCIAANHTPLMAVIYAKEKAFSIKALIFFHNSEAP